jgi:hypothetical protein
MFHDLPGFLFTGALSLPGFLAYAGDPGLAMMAFVFLLLAGCLSALADPGAPFRTAAERRAPSRRRR